MDEKNINQMIKLVDAYLKKRLAFTSSRARNLEQAMYYAVFPGGKRIRPLLVLSVAKILDIPFKKILPVACGIELIHSFSLVHDDLPCMDNDDFRRGKPSCHKKFGEAEALLAGDALLCLGIREIAKCGSPEAVIITCNALGSNGMAGGQSLDMAYKNKKIPHKIKIWIDEKKTGELFRLCFEIPAIVGKADKDVVGKLRQTGALFGEAFQILDDIHDKEGNEKSLKKRLKKTYQQLLTQLENFGSRADILTSLIRMSFGSFVSD
ncbi:MAG TPA: polyprenyl synthetase family protein [bacterium]|nr:polyprenyl synthetase family protein [bacterium]HOL34385.1 polyprenyl synthetase family protein [bacterium]HPP07950.1 polyprenyl synthetase family protein [bacterium]